ncbi:Anosmin-1, partial [Orchesella cincta]
MNKLRVISNGIVVTILLIVLGEYGVAQMGNRQMRPFQQMGPGNRRPKVAPIMCSHDTLMIYQDCRMCVCPRPNRVAKCFPKSCDLRTKDSGQCPAALLRMDDSKVCALNQFAGCKIDSDCPGPQLCCFDFCGSARCQNPVPLDIISGFPHKGRGY